MEYTSVLKMLKEQKKHESVSVKLFRYSGLIQAIEFFSQKLNFEQIIDAAFDFVNELLTIENSAAFVMKGNSYVLRKTKGYGTGTSIIKCSESLKSIAVLHGTLISDANTLLKYFDKQVIEEYKVTTAVPLIMEHILYGFIFISNKVLGDLNSDDYIIGEALMKLFNNALENYKRYEELHKANSELDEKVFNLFAINQSTKALMSELNLEVLYNLSVDVFAELTQSSSTGFMLFDDKSGRYVLKAFKDIYYSEPDSNIGLTLNKLGRIDVNKMIIHVKDEADRLYFNSLFIEGIEILESIKPVYVVFLIKNNKILGLVLLGKNVTGSEYKKGMFELIESLASATYTSLSNARLFKKVSEQKKVIQEKLDRLLSLNNLMKNINSSTDADTLLELTAKTLDISFETEKALIVLYDKEKGVFRISRKMNIETGQSEIEITPAWEKVMEGDTVFEAKEEGALEFIDRPLLEDIGGCQGVLIVPIYIDRVEIEILGALLVFKYKKLPITDEESILTMEAIAGHIAPVLSNLSQLETQKRTLLPNTIALFKEDLQRELEEAAEFTMHLQVVQVVDARAFSFAGNDLEDRLKSSFRKVYAFSYNHIFIIIDEMEADVEEKLERVTELEGIKIRSMEFGKDFSSNEEFFKLFG